MKDFSEKYFDADFVYPMHLKSNILKPIYMVFGVCFLRTILFFINPFQYLEFFYLMCKENFVLTDSCGIQAQVPSLGKTILLICDTTERPEQHSRGTEHLVGVDYDKIMNEANILIDYQVACDMKSKAVNSFGDVKACGGNVEVLKCIDIIVFSLHIS